MRLERSNCEFSSCIQMKVRAATTSFPPYMRMSQLIPTIFCSHQVYVGDYGPDRLTENSVCVSNQPYLPAGGDPVVVKCDRPVVGKYGGSNLQFVVACENVANAVMYTRLRQRIIQLDAIPLYKTDEFKDIQLKE